MFFFYGSISQVDSKVDKKICQGDKKLRQVDKMLEAADYKESNEEDYRRMMADEEVMMTILIQGDLFNCTPPPSFITKIKKWNKPDLLFHEILHLKELQVGSLAFFILALNKGGPVKKIALYICDWCCRQVYGRLM